MGFSQQIVRSLRKTRIMKKAIREETKNGNNPKQILRREELFTFLCKDQILGRVINGFSFDSFSNAIDYLKNNYKLWSAHGDYIPICTFCFLLPLSIAVGYFVENEVTWEDFKSFLDQYNEEY